MAADKFPLPEFILLEQMGLGSLHGGEAELLYVHVCVCDCVCVCALVFEAEKGLNWMHKMAAALSPFPPLSLFARSGSTNTYAHTKKNWCIKVGHM